LDGVEFELCAPALLVCRTDLPGEGVGVDVILGQRVHSLWIYSDTKGIINCLHVALFPGINIDPEDELSWGVIDVLAYNDPYKNNKLVYAKTGAKTYHSIDELHDIVQKKVEDLKPLSSHPN
jgi:hypothetical protein